MTGCPVCIACCSSCRIAHVWPGVHSSGTAISIFMIACYSVPLLGGRLYFWRPPDRRKDLAGQDHSQGWRGALSRQRQPATRAQRAALTVISAPAAGCPARGGRPGGSCRRGHPGCVTAGTAWRRVRGNGAAAAARAGARQRLRQRAKLPPHSGEVPSPLQPPTAQHPSTVHASLGDPRAQAWSPARAGRPGAPKARP